MDEQPPQDPQGQMPPQGVPSGPPPGWYPDPGGQPVMRWWSGMGWTPATQPLPGQQGPQPPAGAQLTIPRPRRSRGRRIAGIIGTVIAALIIVIIIDAALTHQSTGSNAGGTVAAGSPSAPAESAPAAAPSPTGLCTTSACIVSDAESLKGTVAKDNSVATKVSCKKSTVKQVVSGTYTIHCTMTYSDGVVADGIASVLTAGSGSVEWEPTDIISDGS
jgi:hypothetical protein